ncbi:MAG: hypothetical protein ACI4HI_00250 [Lachnospiraceae bacterium]
MKGRCKIHPKPLKKQKRKQKNREKKSSKMALWYLYYPNLKLELQQFDCVLSVWKYLGLLLSASVLLFLMGELFHMRILYRFLVVAVTVGVFPAMIRNRAKRRFEDKRFSDVGIYMEQMLYAFQKEQKIVTALDNVRTLFPQGRMHEALEHALQQMESDYRSESPVHEALKKIEQGYSCDRLHAMHQFMEKVELLGGSYDNSIELLLNDKHMWEKRILERKKEAESTRRNVIVSIVLSLLVCVSTLYFMPKDMDILAFSVTHLSAAVVLVLDLFILYKADQKLTCDWLNSQNSASDRTLEKQYLRFVQYDEKKEQKKSFFYSLIPAVFFGKTLVCHQMKGALLFGSLTFFFLMQHKIGHTLNQKRVTKEVEKAFPQWLMEIALLLQVDNVQVSLKKTYDSAPAILRPALLELVKKLERNPEAVTPYTDFLQELELPEIQAAMKMLYSISNGTGGDASQQIYEIIQRNHILMDQAEKIQQQEQAAGCNIYFLLPMLSGALKLILDLSVFLVAFLQMGGQTMS